MQKKAQLKVFRGDSKGGAFKEYEVPLHEGMVVLDAIHHIQAKEDTTLSVRWNCKADKCGSCGGDVHDKNGSAPPRQTNNSRTDESLSHHQRFGL